MRLRRSLTISSVVIASTVLANPLRSSLLAQRAAGLPIGIAVPRAAVPTATLTPERAQAFVTAAEQHLDYLPGDVLVKFKAGMAPARQQRALSTLRSHPAVGDLQWMGDVARLHDATEPDGRRLASQLAAQPEVEYAQPNYIRKLPGWRLAARPLAGALAVGPPAGPTVQGSPNDPDFHVLQWNFSLINMPGAWDINPGATPSIIAAVIDTGLTTTSAPLPARLWTGQQFDTVSLRFGVSPDLSASRVVSPLDFVFNAGSTAVQDFDGHGTHVASTIAEDANNMLGLAGMAYNVRVMPLKVCVSFWELMIARAQSNQTGYLPVDAGGCSDDAIITAIHYAVDNGARVINMSLGGPGADFGVADALRYAVSQGAFVAISAGNDYEDGNPTDYPAGFAVNLDGVMAVAAVGKSKTRAYYSETGSQIEIAAPGGSDRDGGGDDQGFIWQVTLDPDATDPLQVSVPRFDRYAEVGYVGTSMAAPHVTALAALLMSQGIKDPKAVEAVIKATALDLGSPGRDDQFGYGLIQPRTALFGLGIIK